MVDQLQKKLKKYHDENKLLKEKLSEVDTFGLEISQSVSKHKVVEANILKDSINKSANFKNTIHNTSTVEPESEDSKKKLFNCHSFQDLKTKTNEKENQGFKFKEPTKDFAFDDKSTPKGNLSLKKSTTSKPGFTTSLSEKEQIPESLHQGRSTIEVNTLMRDSSQNKTSILATDKTDNYSPTGVARRFT